MLIPASLDYREFGNLIRAKLYADRRSYRQLVDVIGCSGADLSRVVNAQPVCYARTVVIGQWAGIDPLKFYIPPVFGCETPDMFHVTGTETVAGETKSQVRA